MADKRELQILLTAKNEASNTVNKMKTEFDSFTKSIGLGTVSLVALAGGIGYIGKSMIQAAGEFEQTKIAFSTMLGSAEQANTLLRDLASFASSTPFELKGIEQSAKQLMAYGFSAREIVPTLKSLGDVSSGLSVPLEQIVYAYGQVRAAGQLYGTELRQFVNAGVPILGELAKMYNVTTAEAKMMVEEGKIGFKDVENAFKGMSGEGGKFFNLMENQSKTLLGRISNLKDNWNVFLREQGQGLLVWAGMFVDKLASIVAWLKNDAEGLNYVGKSMYGLTQFFKLFGDTLMAIIKTFAAFGSVIVDTSKLLYSFVKVGINNFKSFGDNLKSVFSAIGQALKGDFDAAGNTIKGIFTSSLSEITKEFDNFQTNQAGTTKFLTDAWSKVGSDMDSFLTLDGFNQATVKFGELGAVMQDKIGGSVGKSKEELKKLSDAFETLGEKTSDFAQKSADALVEVGNKIADLKSQLNDVFVKNAQDNLNLNQDYAEAYVSQEKKVNDLRADIANESDLQKRLLLQNQLNKEQQVLNERKTIEIAFQNEVNEERRKASLTDFERTLEDLEKKRLVLQQEFEAQTTKIARELAAELLKSEKIKEIQDIALKANDKFLAEQEKQTSASVNKQIEYYNQLAAAVARAKEGKSTALTGVTKEAQNRSSQVIPQVNLTVNGDVSGKELVEKVKESIMNMLSLNGKLTF